MKTGMKCALLTLCIASVQGCVAWQNVKAVPFVNANAKYSIQLPANWKQLTVGQTLTASLYGPQLQSIRVEFHKHKQAFRSQKKDSTPDMSPEELADALVAELKAASNADVYDVLKTEPAMIGGRAGFRAELASKRTFQGDGIRFRHVIYGVAAEAGLYTIWYQAPVIHYYEKNLAEFESAAKSFTLLSRKLRAS